MSQPAIPPSYGARQAQPLDAMIEQAAGAGWDFFAEILGTKDRRGTWEEAVTERSAEAAAAAGRLMLDRPQPGDFRVLVEFLADIAARRADFILGMPDPLLYAALREGQKGLFFTLLRLIAVGRGEQPTVREGT